MKCHTQIRYKYVVIAIYYAISYANNALGYFIYHITTFHSNLQIVNSILLWTSFKIVSIQNYKPHFNDITTMIMKNFLFYNDNEELSLKILLLLLQISLPTSFIYPLNLQHAWFIALIYFLWSYSSWVHRRTI